MTRQRTYWHLSALGRKPSDYDIASSELLYHPRRGFEVQTPVTAWFERYQAGSALRCKDWERFRDPRATTYASYVTHQRNQEIFVDGLLAADERDGAAANLPAAWLRTLDQVLGTLRFPLHGLQMVAAYIGSLAPSGKIAIACAFQVGDEIRRIQRLTQRMAQLARVHNGLGRDAKNAWQHAPAWQPLRELIERLLVAYDWGEALSVLSLLVKPCLDRVFMVELGELARARHDDTLHRMIGSLHADCVWHAQWSSTLLQLPAQETDESRAAIAAWLEPWRPRVLAALVPLLPLLETGESSARPDLGSPLAQRVHACVREVPTWLGRSAGTLPTSFAQEST